MLKNIVFLIFIFCCTLLNAQKVKLTGDSYFFEYNYKKAITAYNVQSRTTNLNKQQRLNLAESYYKIKEYKNSWETYSEVYTQYPLMLPYHINNMLSSLSKTSGLDAVTKFINENNIFKESVWLENYKLNSESFDEKNQSNLNYKIFNQNTNTAYAEFSPSFYGEKVLFTSDRKVKSTKSHKESAHNYLKLFVAKENLNGDFQNVSEFDGIPKSNFHKATPFYSKEVDQIFYVLSNEKDGEMLFGNNGKNALSIGVVDKDDKFKFLLKNLKTSFYYPFYDSESDRLYFSANFDDGYGGTDIYYVNTNKGNIMSSPVNLGPTINTPGNEIAPYIFENTFYFSSDVFYGLGGMDVYSSNIQDDNVIGVPINLGDKINSPKDDFGFIIKNNDNGGLSGYFSSNRDGGKGNDDIYGFKVDEKPKSNTYIIKGKITQKNTIIGLPNVNIVLTDASNKIIKRTNTNANGEYMFEVLAMQEGKLEFAKNRYASSEISFKIDDIKKKKGVLDISLPFVGDFVEDREGQKVVKLNKFFFKRNSSTINSEVAKELDKVVAVVDKFPSFNLRIESYSNSKGSDTRNFELTQERSDAIKKYLVLKGVPSRNILYALGYGEDKLLNHCKDGVYCTDFAHKENERSLIVILNYEELFSN